MVCIILHFSTLSHTISHSPTLYVYTESLQRSGAPHYTVFSNSKSHFYPVNAHLSVSQGHCTLLYTYILLYESRLLLLLYVYVLSVSIYVYVLLLSYILLLVSYISSGVTSVFWVLVICFVDKVNTFVLYLACRTKGDAPRPLPEGFGFKSKYTYMTKLNIRSQKMLRVWLHTDYAMEQEDWQYLLYLVLAANLSLGLGLLIGLLLCL